MSARVARSRAGAPPPPPSARRAARADRASTPNEITIKTGQSSRLPINLYLNNYKL